MHLLDGQRRPVEIPESLVAVRGDGMEDDMIMNMGFVCVSGNDERVFALGETHTKFIAQLAGQLRCDLTGLEGLPDLVGDDFVPGFTSGAEWILGSGQHPFLDRCFRVAGVSTDERSAFSF